MINRMSKFTIITLKKKGKSFRSIAEKVIGDIDYDISSRENIKWIVNTYSDH